MSGLLTMLIRHDGSNDRFVCTSGALTTLYNPAIYAGDSQAIKQFIETNSLTADEYRGPRLMAPLDYGMVVLDIDAKRRWDAQVARDLNELSMNFDWTWVHGSAMEASGGFGLGLVRHGTQEVVVPFPEEIFDIPSWYDAEVEKSYARTKRRLGPAVDREQRIEVQIADAPRLRYAPPGWQLHTYDACHPTAVLAMQDSLKDAGFQFSDEDVSVWNAWARRRASTPAEP